jgi:hypothetical protein
MHYEPSELRLLYQSILRNIPEDLNSHERRCHNIEFCIKFYVLNFLFACIASYVHKQIFYRYYIRSKWYFVGNVN